MATTPRRTSHNDPTIRNNHRRAIARTQPPCWICGELIDYTLKYPHKRSFVVDHIVPLAHGGSDGLENKAAAHSECNREKSDKPHGAVIKRSGSLNRPNT